MKTPIPYDDTAIHQRHNTASRKLKDFLKKHCPLIKWRVQGYIEQIMTDPADTDLNLMAKATINGRILIGRYRISLELIENANFDSYCSELIDSTINYIGEMIKACPDGPVEPPVFLSRQESQP